MHERTDEELMAAYQGGDQEAFRALWERYSGPLHGAVRRRVGDDEAASDIVQQAFLRFHRARRDFRSGHAVRPWLYTIALNITRDWLRYHGRRINVEWDERDFPVEHDDVASRKQDVERVRAAIEELDTAQRQVIELHWLEGLSFREIAEITGEGISALKVRAHRTYAKLRQALGEK